MLLIDVVTQMYRMAGALKAAGRGINGSQQDEGLHIVNSLLDGVKIERFFFYQILRNVFDLESGTKEYMVGAEDLGADWVIERPEKVLSAGVLVPSSSQSTTAEIPVYVVQSYEEYARIVVKDVGSSLVQVLYYQPSLPLGSAIAWPIPNQDGSIVLYTPQTVQEFTDIQGDFLVPKGYREFLEYAGAVAVHDRYPDLHMDPNVRQKAVEYKSRIKAAQLTPDFMRSDGAVLRPGSSDPSWVFNGRTLLS